MAEMDLEGLLGNDRIVHICGSPSSRMRQAMADSVDLDRIRIERFGRRSANDDVRVTLQFTEYKGRGTGA
jgi:hypothetical protein